MNSAPHPGHFPGFRVAPLLLVWGLASCTCGTPPPPPVGAARVLVSCTTACDAINRVTLTVTAGDGAAMNPIGADLPASGSQWSGRISTIPVGAGRRFDAVGYGADGSQLQTGSARSDISATSVAVVSIALNPPQPPGGNHPPVIDGISASSNPVPSGVTVTVIVTAHDPDPGDTLGYLWQATCGSFEMPSRPTSHWTAPAAEGTCTLSVRVTDPHGASVSAALPLTVSATGSATVGTVFNDWPIITSLSTRIVLGRQMTGELAVSATDPDGDPLSYAWTSTCAGLTFDITPPYGPTTPHFMMPGPSAACTVAVTVTDPPTRGGLVTGSLGLPANALCLGVICGPGQTCDPSDGKCKGTELCAKVICPPATDLCHVAGTCDPATGLCSPQIPKTCPSGQTCDPVDGVCKGASGASAVVPYSATSLHLTSFQGVALALDGASYVTGNLTGTQTFGSFTLTSAGANDIFVGKYTSTGTVAFARNFGDASDQTTTGIAVTSTAVVAIGQFNGQFSGLNNPKSYAIDYVLFLDPATGAVAAAQQYDLGLGGNLVSVGANPSLGLVAVCGQAVQAATQLVPGATYAGATDVVIALFNSAGALQWTKQVGSANGESCTAITVDRNGDVVAAGKYSGVAPALAFTGIPLPPPGSSFRQHLWVAKFNGTTGSVIAQKSYGANAGSHQPNGIATDGANNYVLAGLFTAGLPIGANNGTTTACTLALPGCLLSAGGSDAFVVRLDPTTLGASFATRLGATGADEGRGVGVDSRGNITFVGLLNGSTTSSTVTPNGVASAAVPALTAPSGVNPAAFVATVPGTTGVFDGATAKPYGNDTNSVNANKVAVNDQGSGGVKDLVVFGGEYQGTVDFGGSSSPVTTTTNANEDFLVFARLQP